MKKKNLVKNTTKIESPDWVILGTGRVGRTLLLLADKLGVEVAFSWSKSRSIDDLGKANEHLHYIGELPKSADYTNRIVFISVVDDAISIVASQLAEKLNSAACVIHLSGLLTSAVLRNAGVERPCASMHPVVAVSDPHLALELLPTIFWSIEGDDEAREIGKNVLAGVQVEPVVIAPETKPLYHAAAVFSAGHIISLIDAAISVAMEAGLNRSDARRMLLPLAHSALNNLDNKTTVKALTGPLSRGDQDVIQVHKKALEGLNSEKPKAIYDILNAYMAQRIQSQD